MNARLTAFVALLRRFPFASGCVAVLCVSGVSAWFLWDDIDTQELARQDRAKEGEATLELLVGGSTQRQELAAVREATRRIEENLIVESNLADNQWYFYRIEEQTKSNLVELHPQSAPAVGDAALYKRIPYTLKVTGSFEQVAAYLLALETGPRLANITSFTFSRRDRDPNALALELSLELLGKK
jgi:Tfp pilus assembly protein PilO